jgi:hypothetical protein
MQAAIDEILIPASSPHRPGANASVVLRAVSPPGGLYSNTEWRVLWRDGDGVWWFWKQNRTNVPPPPPPPPGTQEHADFMARFPNGVIPDDIRWPPESGRLHADLAAALDSALFDPCRAWEPDIWPRDTPITRGARQPPPLPPQDSSQTYVELREGERARFIAGDRHTPIEPLQPCPQIRLTIAESRRVRRPFDRLMSRREMKAPPNTLPSG